MFTYNIRVIVITLLEKDDNIYIRYKRVCVLVNKI